MAQNYVWPAQSVTATNPSVAPNNGPIASQSTLVAGKDGSGNQVPVSVDSSGDVNVNVVSSTLPTGGATAANQVIEISHLANIDTNTIHVDTNNVTVVSSTLPTGAATSANQTTEIGHLASIDTSVASIDSKTVHVDTGNVTVVASALPSGAATEATIAARLSGSLVPAAYDEIDLTYIIAGPGTGQIGTAIYKLATVTIKTLTLTYDGSDRLSSVVAS